MPNPGNYNERYVVSDMHARYEESPNNPIKLADLYANFRFGPPAWETPLFRCDFEHCLLVAFPGIIIITLCNVKFVIGLKLKETPNGKQESD